MSDNKNNIQNNTNGSNNEDNNELRNDALRTDALNYHLSFPYGKIGITSKICSAQQMRYAYSPGVAYACQEIQKDKTTARRLTMKGNNVTVITNGTAVLGLGDIGALAGKPVMEGKVLLMNKLAGIDATELCIQEKDVNKLYEIIAACSDSFGCINLEDIKAPECFELLERLENTVDVPVFHDDQDGTATVATAALINALKLSNKQLHDVKVVSSGAGAAMLATLRLLEKFGLQPKNVVLFDSKGVIYSERTDLTDQKKRYCVDTQLTLSQALQGADVFIGLSASNVLKGEDLMGMNANPVILAMANPVPEILPEVVKAFRPDAIIGTGRSDYPNQVNNASCFPYLFRGVLDAQARKITTSMLRAVVEGLSVLAQNDSDFGVEKIMPNILDPRLPYVIVKKVIDAAIADGVAGLIDRFALHMYLFKVFVWDNIIKMEAKNAVCVTGLHANVLEPYVEDFSNEDGMHKFTVNITSELDLYADSDKKIYLFRNGMDVFCVSPGNMRIFDLPIMDIKLDIACQLHDFIGYVVLHDKQAFVLSDLPKAMFMSALLSRVN